MKKISIEDLKLLVDFFQLKSSWLINYLNNKLGTKLKPRYTTYIYTEHWDDNIYVLKSYGESENLIKVGYSDNIESRLKQYINHNPNAEIIDTFHIYNAKEFEINFHKNRKSTVRREWYEENKLDKILRIVEAETEKSKEIILSEL